LKKVSLIRQSQRKVLMKGNNFFLDDGHDEIREEFVKLYVLI